MSTVIEPPIEQNEKNLEELETVTIRFAGDSGDGMQLTGTQFTNTSAVIGNDISTLPDFPAEIRAPAGSLPGVSGFQLNFSSQDIKTPGDQPNVLVAMNPAALKVNISDLEEGGTIIVNTDGFTKENLKYAAYDTNPLEDDTLKGYRVHKLPVTTLNMNALKGQVELSRKEMDRCKNFFALGVLYWLYDRPMGTTLEWIRAKFSKLPEVARANEIALKTGYNFADTTEVFTTHYTVKKAQIAPGKYRKITGNEATAIGFIAASQIAGRPLFYGSYPITPASDIPGRGRDCGHLRRHRCEFRRADWSHRNIRSGRCAQAGGHRPRRHDRTPARHHQRAARRSINGPADEDGTGRPLPGRLGTQRRMSRDCRRARDARRLFRHGD
jgi:2-oxoglutarate ferredoxin oxidoreductase subunit alpha